MDRDLSAASNMDMFRLIATASYLGAKTIAHQSYQDRRPQDNATPLLASVQPVYREEPEGVANARLALVETLIEFDSDMDARNATSATPLIVAARGKPKHKLAIIKALLKAGADVNAIDAQGETALIAAVASDDLEAVQMLFGAGAYNEARAGSGSALDVAHLFGLKRIEQWLYKQVITKANLATTLGYHVSTGTALI